MPKREEKKGLLKGARNCPPSASAANKHWASPSPRTDSDSEKPSKFGLPRQWRSEVIRVESPLLKLACMSLFSALGGTKPCSSGVGCSL